jgi:hypothetical protein
VAFFLIEQGDGKPGAMTPKCLQDTPTRQIAEPLSFSANQLIGINSAQRAHNPVAIQEHIAVIWLVRTPGELEGSEPRFDWDVGILMIVQESRHAWQISSKNRSDLWYRAQEGLRRPSTGMERAAMLLVLSRLPL